MHIVVMERDVDTRYGKQLHSTVYREFRHVTVENMGDHFIVKAGNTRHRCDRIWVDDEPITTSRMF